MYDRDKLKICPQCQQGMIPDLILKDGRGINTSAVKDSTPDNIAGYGYFCQACQYGWTGETLHQKQNER
ncbi:MAG: hypothetical protein AAF485_18775 [Chloroflexota bacterium]